MVLALAGWVGLAGWSVGSAGAAPLTTTAPPSGPTSCNFCVLDPSAASALTVGGGSVLRVNGNIVVDSTASNAATVTHGSTVWASNQPNGIGYVGGWSTSANSTTSPSPEPTAGAPDCLASAATPVPSGVNKGSLVVAKNTSATASPGNYQDLGSSGGALTLQAGLYTVTGSFTNSGGGQISGSGVELYFPNSATFHLSRTSVTTLDAGSSGNVLVFYDRTNRQALRIDAGATATLSGDLYARAGQLVGAAGYIDASCISVDKAQIDNGAMFVQLPEGGVLGLVVFLGLFGTALLVLCLLSTPRIIRSRARSRRERDTEEPLGPASPWARDRLPEDPGAPALTGSRADEAPGERDSC